MGQATSRRQGVRTNGESQTAQVEQTRDRRRSLVPKGVKKRLDTVRRRTWYGGKAHAEPTKHNETRVSTTSHTDTNASSVPSSPLIRTPEISPTPPARTAPTVEKGPVVELASSTSINESSIQGTQPEARGNNVLPPSRNLSRRSSRLDVNNDIDASEPSTESTPSSLPAIPPSPSPLSSIPTPALAQEDHTPSTPSPVHAGPNPIPTLSNPQPTPGPRQFPPPGTLVLVQGVVQTTDVPRLPNVSTDNVLSSVTRLGTSSDSGSAARNRPSPPIIPTTSPTEILTETPEGSEQPQQSADVPVSPASNESTPGNGETADAPALESHESASPAPQPSTQMSPNSVEVLGTLLSVAAAATAASLLAGSTENILTPPRPDAHGPRGADGGDFSAAARRERMRHAWQSVRERLGLRPSTTPAVPGDGQPVDAREVMLAEMARAFNLGLGIGPDSGEDAGAAAAAAVNASQSQHTSPGSQAQSPSPQSTPAAPGSFERFLTDLQHDLRGVLNEERSTSAEPSVAQGNGEVRTEATPAEPMRNSGTPSESSAEPTVQDSSPAAEPVSSNNAPEATAANNDQESGSRNVNWWRMYRFPAVNAHNNSSAPLSPLAPQTTTPPTENGSAPIPIPSDSPHSPPIPSNVVHPIVVVGLRSVNPPGFHMPMGGLSPSPAPERGHPSWANRATDPLRNPRPGGRRSEEREEVNTTPRTFLIFVIGGYYPPDHSMVTGGENGLASFEALLELAEMLGQAKPQTATKDDIERSGLEIIKAADLPKYEAEKRISSNCTERCLICLDDYAEEDPIRVLKCRHAFHKTCVDRWLETGRNNCPACRSAGVSTDSSSSAF